MKASSNNIAQYALLPETWRTMHIVSAREFRGTSFITNDEGQRVRTTLVDLTFEDNETGVQVHQNYSLDKPTYIAGVLEAIAPGEFAELLDSIDWETNDIDRIMNVDIKVKVYHQEFPENSGRYQNRVGNVVNIDTAPEDTMPEGAITNTVAPGTSPNRGIQSNTMPRGAASTGPANLAGTNDNEDEDEDEAF